ncbi:MAG: hypothetical protein RJA70_641 [Pseudomonadota bacterium]
MQLRVSVRREKNHLRDLPSRQEVKRQAQAVAIGQVQIKDPETEPMCDAARRQAVTSQGHLKTVGPKDATHRTSHELIVFDQ